MLNIDKTTHPNQIQLFKFGLYPLDNIRVKFEPSYETLSLSKVILDTFILVNISYKRLTKKFMLSFKYKYLMKFKNTLCYFDIGSSNEMI